MLNFGVSKLGVKGGGGGGGSASAYEVLILTFPINY